MSKTPSEMQEINGGICLGGDFNLPYLCFDRIVCNITLSTINAIPT